ncbi:MAG: hypothetical protein ACKOUR_02230, partial [Planctomycetota bacterium]
MAGSQLPPRIRRDECQIVFKFTTYASREWVLWGLDSSAPGGALARGHPGGAAAARIRPESWQAVATAEPLRITETAPPKPVLSFAKKLPMVAV